MNLINLLLQNLVAKYYGDLTVDNTPGGVGFDPAKLTWEGFPAKVVRCSLEGGDSRSKETGVPTATSGDLWIDGDKFLVVGEESVRNFRAIRTGDTNGTVRYHVYF